MNSSQDTDRSRLTATQITTGVITLLLIALTIVFDVFAFLNGATATISQVVLAVNRKTGDSLTWLLAFLAGGLAVHFTITKDQAGSPTTSLWPTLGLALTAFVAGAVLVYAVPVLKQLPGRD